MIKYWNELYKKKTDPHEVSLLHKSMIATFYLYMQLFAQKIAKKCPFCTKTTKNEDLSLKIALQNKVRTLFGCKVTTIF